MKSNQLKSRVGGLILAVSVLFGIGLLSGTTVQAQWRRDDGDNRRDRDRSNRRDRNRDDRYHRNDRYRSEDRYRRDDRDRRDNRYRRDDRYGNYGGYGSNGRYGNNDYQAALNQGYQQGLYTGSSDAQRGQSYNPQRSRYYRNPTDGYNSSYGNRGQYQQAYRNGFLRGYQEGYQRYGYNNGRRNRGLFPW